MSQNGKMLTYHKYSSSKQRMISVWTHYETSSDSGKTNNSMNFHSIVVQPAMNWHAQYNSMAAIAGYPYFDRYMYSQNLLFLNWRLHPDLFFMHSCDWSWVEIKYRQVVNWHELQAFKSCSRWEIASHWLSRLLVTAVQIQSLRALLMGIALYNLF
jgi:hypothetical protein